MCTGHDLSEDPSQLTEAGADGFITKPYQPADMIAKIASFLK
jgi:DNA-binding response OmpR family regulator